jgi:branched-chain amino acid transport system substrate-binding protein
LPNSRALTKIQSIILIAIIVVAAVGGGAAYVWFSGDEQSSDTIKIGFLGMLDSSIDRANWQAAILAVEEINAEGGILGRQVELIAEDANPYDLLIFTEALTRLITVHNVDFIVGGASGQAEIVLQDTIAQHKIICISGGIITDEIAQKVLDNYDTFRYYFSVQFNTTSVKLGMTDGLLHVREMTGFNKIGYLAEDLGWNKATRDELDVFLPENGFELVYKGTFPLGTVDFSSYFAAAEAAGVEVMVPLILLDGGIPFCKEYYDRQSPMAVLEGNNDLASNSHGWEWTDGKCNHMAFNNVPTTAGYPFTSKTLQTRDAYMNRWGEAITWGAADKYDAIKFILKDAIERAGTIETDAVIAALEETRVETSNARNFVFTPSHCIMWGKDANNPDQDYHLVMRFQWQNGVQVPVYPKKIMDEAGTSYTFPDWPGPWD